RRPPQAAGDGGHLPVPRGPLPGARRAHRQRARLRPAGPVVSALTVGVDGGQSQIRLRVSDDPEVLTTSGVSHATAGPAGQPDAATAVVEAVRQLWTPGRGAIARLVVGLTTVPSAAAARQHVAARLAAAVDAGEVWVTGDDVTSHAGALGGRSG